MACWFVGDAAVQQVGCGCMHVKLWPHSMVAVAVLISGVWRARRPSVAVAADGGTEH